jgi:hypothetical protein
VVRGQTLDIYTGTTTLYVTATYTNPPRTDIHCEAVRDVYNPATCDTVTPLAWASLILTFITVHLTWWVFDVPILWKKRPADEGHNPYPENNLTRTKRDAVKANDRLGLGGFLLSIAWACLRANAPGCAALYALMAGRDTGDYAAIYYLGVRRLRDGRAPEFTTWKLTTSIGTDLLSLVRVALALLLWRFDRPNDGWFFPVICYGAMAFPAVLFGVPFILLATAYGCFSRVGGVTLAAWQHYAGGQPFCKIPGIGFAVVYLTLGGISALLALLAIVLYQTDMGWWLSYSSLDPQVKLAGGSDLGRNIGERREGTVVLM